MNLTAKKIFCLALSDNFYKVIHSNNKQSSVDIRTNS